MIKIFCTLLFFLTVGSAFAANDVVTLEELNLNTKEIKYFELSSEPLKRKLTGLSFHVTRTNKKNGIDSVSVLFSDSSSALFFCPLSRRKDIAGLVFAKSKSTKPPKTGTWKDRAIQSSTAFKYVIVCNK